MKRIAVVLSVILSFAAIGAAQVSDSNNLWNVRTVTNTELEKFKQKRLAADLDYRENYARLGFPSPQELDRQFEESRIEREELSAKLREERLERERIEADRARAEAELAAAYIANQPQTVESSQPFYNYGSYGGYGSYYGGYGYRYGRGVFGRFGRFPFRSRSLGGIRYVTIPGYRATPVGVYDAPVRVPIFTSRPRGRRR